MSDSGNSVSEGREGAAALGQMLAGLPTVEQGRGLVDLVREQAAAIVRAVRPDAPAAGTVSSGKTFRELGLDSLATVELHARLSAATGRELPVTSAFDYPTPELLAGYLSAEVLGLPAAGTGEGQAKRRVSAAGSGLDQVSRSRLSGSGAGTRAGWPRRRTSGGWSPARPT